MEIKSRINEVNGALQQVQAQVTLMHKYKKIFELNQQKNSTVDDAYTLFKGNILFIADKISNEVDIATCSLGSIGLLFEKHVIKDNHRYVAALKKIRSMNNPSSLEAQLRKNNLVLQKKLGMQSQRFVQASLGAVSMQKKLDTATQDMDDLKAEFEKYKCYVTQEIAARDLRIIQQSQLIETLQSKSSSSIDADHTSGSSPKSKPPKKSMLSDEVPPRKHISERRSESLASAREKATALLYSSGEASSCALSSSPPNKLSSLDSLNSRLDALIQTNEELRTNRFLRTTERKIDNIENQHANDLQSSKSSALKQKTIPVKVLRDHWAPSNNISGNDPDSLKDTTTPRVINSINQESSHPGPKKSPPKLPLRSAPKNHHATPSKTAKPAYQSQSPFTI